MFRLDAERTTYGTVEHLPHKPVADTNPNTAPVAGIQQGDLRCQLQYQDKLTHNAKSSLIPRGFYISLKYISVDPIIQEENRQNLTFLSIW